VFMWTCFRVKLDVSCRIEGLNRAYSNRRENQSAPEVVDKTTKHYVISPPDTPTPSIRGHAYATREGFAVTLPLDRQLPPPTRATLRVRG
jgi:hypothetical protein